MLPEVSHPVWVQIVTGEKSLRSTKASINMMIQNNKRSFQRDPSPANVMALVSRTHAFFTQFQSMFVNEINEFFR